MTKKFNKIQKKHRILIVPLDWGLGHATRCIPLIKELLANESEVIIAAEKATKSLLQHEFQQLTFIDLKGYRINYSKQKKWLPFTILYQVPKILLRIYQEQQWIKKVVKNLSITAIIADNRFGLYHSDIPCVYITHQLLIKTGNKFSENIAQRIHYWFIKKYNFCWVPDFDGKKNIAGELSHPLKPPFNTRYIGCLSRFENKQGVAKNYDLLVLISGPEPQRSLFEELMLQQLKTYEGKVLLVRGLPGPGESEEVFYKKKHTTSIAIKNHLPARELNQAIQQAGIVICRSGYTTIMDLLKLQQKAILVPTPGQTEQEYLAWHLMKQDIFFAACQEGFTLRDAIDEAADFPFAIPEFDMELYKVAVCDFIKRM